MNSHALGEIPDTEPQTMARSGQIRLRFLIEYAAAKAVLDLLGCMPHRTARWVCAALGALSYWLWPRLRSTGIRNLSLAYPDWTGRQRRKVLFASFQNLGRMLADFSHFPHWNRSNIGNLIDYDGFEHFERAAKLGKGVLFLTAHFGNWELGSFAHGVWGHPVNFVARRLDNPLMESLINHYRCLSGGRPIHKNDFARQALRALRRGESVGILMDQNMLPAEGIFVDFFGIPASTAIAPARIAQKEGSPLVLGLVIWDTKLRKYRLRFEDVGWIASPDPAEEIRVNTQHFTALLERYIRQYPTQWLWVHRRWKTRPPGDPPLYH
ncbi:MAG: lysophospholipid acyltransferase family protein [Acidobacteriota bacterium]|nr:lysophospholipid acyltransferase family protein [Acidobacteriota bacterium]